jgi:predicted ferric reductase
MPTAREPSVSTAVQVRPTSRERQSVSLFGPLAVTAIVVAYGALWLIARPHGQPAGRYLAEMAGMLALLLLSMTLVLSSGLMSLLEPAFGGFDRVMVWHRGLAVIGVLVIVAHRILIGESPNNPYKSDLGDALGAVAALGLVLLVLWAFAPRLRRLQRLHLIARMAASTYERWRIGHRFTGLLVAMATVHAAIVDPVLHASAPLLASELAAGGLGVAAYLYRELLAPRLTPVYQYTVQEADRLNENTLQVALTPVGKPIRFVAGQFILLALGAPEQFAYHPFTVASAPNEDELRVSVKAVGDYTGRLYADLRPGIEARVVGPFGTFDYRLGLERQIWIAAGIGITPFISWVRALDGSFDYDVDFYYSVASEAGAIFVDEIKAATGKYPSLNLHLVRTDRDPQLSPQQIYTEHSLAQCSIYMCGPPGMMRAFEKEFRKHGAALNQIRWEQFGLR